MNAATRVGTLIRDRRTARGLTQVELANTLDLRQTTISRWEQGQYLPDVDRIADLIIQLDIDPAALARAWWGIDIDGEVA